MVPAAPASSAAVPSGANAVSSGAAVPSAPSGSAVPPAAGPSSGAVPPSYGSVPGAGTVTALTTATAVSTAYNTVTAVASPTPELPTAAVTSFPTPGTYTIPAKTITVSEETTVPAPTTTAVPPGTHTVGGVTTVVVTRTTITCPYATIEPSGSTVTSVIRETTYVCPSAGTYTIAPITTYVPTSTVLVIPTPATITPGTYTQPEQTVTVTETDYTYVCPFSTGLPSGAAATGLPNTAGVTTTPVSVPAYTPAPAPASSPVSSAAGSSPAGSSPVSAPAAPASSPATATASASAVPTGTSSTATDSNGKINGGQRYGITYSPYTSDGQCKDKSSVEQDIAQIKARGFTAVRIYSTDCNGLEYVGAAARAAGLRLIIGVYISSSGISAAQDQVTTIASWAQWDLVDLVVVGNEALLNGWVDASSLAGFISSCKSTFQQSGYSGMVTTAEPLNIWQQYGSTLCGVVDRVGGNVHPFFNSQVAPEDAGDFVKSELALLDGICPGLKANAINLETGWPHAGDANGLAVPGTIQQLTALTSISNSCGDRSVFFSFADDLWKQAGEFDVEKSWGCLDVFSILEPVTDILNKVLGAISS